MRPDGLDLEVCERVIHVEQECGIVTAARTVSVWDLQIESGADGSAVHLFRSCGCRGIRMYDSGKWATDVIREVRSGRRTAVDLVVRLLGGLQDGQHSPVCRFSGVGGV